MKKEILALLVLLVFLLAAVAVPAAGWRLTFRQNDTVNLHASMPENGGWSISSISAVAGQPLILRLTSDDVVHGFAVGKSGEPAIDLPPGEVIETTLLFDRPGKYTFYCSRWCGPNHWRMRGVIEVSAPPGSLLEPLPLDPRPLYLRLGLDPDSPHRAEVTPNSLPSAARGEPYASLLPEGVTGRDAYLSHSPEAVWQSLRLEPALSHLDDHSLWDMVAWIWAQQTSPQALAAGQRLYAENCAACHGETGQGNGVMVRDLPEWRPGEHTPGGMGHERSGEGLVRPPDFTDPANLLGASPALLEGKILRGGMGTGMPYWGPILTGEQLDAVIAYLYSLVLGD